MASNFEFFSADLGNGCKSNNVVGFIALAASSFSDRGIEIVSKNSRPTYRSETTETVSWLGRGSVSGIVVLITTGSKRSRLCTTNIWWK